MVTPVSKNLNSLFNPLMRFKFELKLICITETWCSDNSTNHSFKSIHHVRRTGKGGSIAVFLHESLTFNIRHDLSVNNADIEALCVEIANKKSKNILITLSVVDQQGISMNLLNPKLLTKHAF